MSRADQTQSRAEQTQEQRRRRNSESLSGQRRRMALDMSKLDTDNFEYRWANNEPGRLEVLTQQDDWEIVTDREGNIKADSTGEGSQVSILAGVGDAGAPVRSVLIRKPKKYQDEDRRAKQRRIDEMEAQLKSGNTPGDGAKGESFYTTENGIRIEQGSRG